jgi:hypothetical protein
VPYVPVPPSEQTLHGCSSSTNSSLVLAAKKKSVDVTVPEIEEMRLAHYVTMGSECTASLAAKYLDSM